MLSSLWPPFPKSPPDLRQLLGLSHRTPGHGMEKGGKTKGTCHLSFEESSRSWRMCNILKSYWPEFGSMVILHLKTSCSTQPFWQGTSSPVGRQSGGRVQGTRCLCHCGPEAFWGDPIGHPWGSATPAAARGWTRWLALGSGEHLGAAAAQPSQLSSSAT